MVLPKQILYSIYTADLFAYFFDLETNILMKLKGEINLWEQTYDLY